MATIIANRSIDLTDGTVFFGSLIEASATTIRISSGGASGIYRGSFSYDQSGRVFGTLRSYESTLFGSVQLKVDDLFIDANVVFNGVNSGDALGVYEYALSGNDTITGSPQNDTLVGYGGNDVIRGGNGSDFLAGSDGSDTIEGGSGNDTLAGGSGSDLLSGGAGIDTAAFAFDQDQYSIVRQNDGSIRIAGQGLDIVSSDVEELLFADGSVATALIGLVSPPPAAVEFDFSDPDFAGGNGSDSIVGTDSNDIIVGLGGDDTIKAGDGSDTIDAGQGFDIVLSGNGDDYILGGSGDDTLKPGRGNDSMDGGDGNDILFAFRGDEVLIGGAGDDTLLGNLDDDTISGGAGDDRMQGGPGRDVFVFDTPEWGDDRIVLDFLTQSDALDFRGSGLTRADLAITQAGGNVLIEAGDSSILVNSQRFGALDAAAFDGDVLIFG